MRTRNLPEHYPADWAKFKYYCIQDVNTEVDIYKRLKKFPMPELEWQHYCTNERINDRWRADRHGTGTGSNHL